MSALVLLFALLLPEANLRDGDIIFQESLSSQSRAIQLATGSRYSHMGIVMRENGRWYVYEAVEPVKLTPLNTWTARGRNGHYVVKRLRDASKLTPAVLRKMEKVGKIRREALRPDVRVERLADLLL